MKRITILGVFFLLSLVLCAGTPSRAAVSNEDCMGCHGEKELTGKGAGGKAVSLFFDQKAFDQSVHKPLACVDCHEVKEVPHPEKLKVKACNTCHGEVFDKYRMSAHGHGKAEKASCKACHGYHTVQQAKALTPSMCASCHPKIVAEYKEGIHGKGDKSGKPVAGCADCHGDTHGMLPKKNSNSPVNPFNLPRTCSRCHGNKEMIKKYNIPAERVYSLYMDSIHGQALTKEGIPVSAACNDCHGSHGIKPHTDRTSRINAMNVSVTCGNCHEEQQKRFDKSIHAKQLKRGNQAAPSYASCHPPHEIQPVKAAAWMLEAIKECGSCHKKPLESYHHSYHGKITNLGFTRVAKCADCHGAHDVLPRSDPNSRISEKNIVATCATCHPKANKSFTTFVAHMDYREKGEHPVFFYVWVFMTGLLIAVFGFFGIHTILWLPRSWIERFRGRGKGREK